MHAGTIVAEGLTKAYRVPVREPVPDALLSDAPLLVVVAVSGLTAWLHARAKSPAGLACSAH